MGLGYVEAFSGILRQLVLGCVPHMFISHSIPTALSISGSCVVSTAALVVLFPVRHAAREQRLESVYPIRLQGP